jgi:hypothetical protein
MFEKQSKKHFRRGSFNTNVINGPEVLSARTKKNGRCVDELKKEASESPFWSVRHNQDTYGQTEMTEKSRM